MIILESTIKRYVGLSTDTKPTGDFANGETLPPGSSFLETDTGVIYRWSGEHWRAARVSDETEELLTAIYLRLDRLATAVELQLAA